MGILRLTDGYRSNVCGRGVFQVRVFAPWGPPPDKSWASFVAM